METVILKSLQNLFTYKNVEFSAKTIWQFLPYLKDERLGMYLFTSMQSIQNHIDHYDLSALKIEAEETYYAILKGDY